MAGTRGWGMILVAAAISGCGSSGSIVVGQVVENGRPYTPPPGFTVQIAARGGPQGATPLAFVSPLDADGSFRLTGPDGGGLPPGRYKLVLSGISYAPAIIKRADIRDFNTVFAADATPFEIDVGSTGQQTIWVDLSTRKIGSQK